MIMETFLQDYWDATFSAFFDPKKRVYYFYLLSSLAVAWCWLALYKKYNFQQAKQAIFSTHIWWSASAQLDYKIFFFNQAIMLLLIPLLFTKLTLATWLFEHIHHWFSRPSWGAQVDKVWVMLAFTSCLFVLDDFAKFYLHRLMHRIPSLWQFHKVHHTAQTMTPLTVYRTHPVEGVLFALRAVLVQGICLAVFFFCFGDAVDLITLLGANAFLFVFNTLGANLRHSHIHIHYPRCLERWLLSPAQHHIHHSLARRHWNKNYGVVLACWDRWWGSHHYAEPQHTFVYGVTGATEHSLGQAYLAPFKYLLSKTKKLKVNFVP